MKVKKHLIFHCYWEKNSEQNLANKYHFACLSYYKHIFDTIEFIICVDDINDKGLINGLRHKILDIFSENTELTIKVTENSLYREAETFKNEVVDNTTFEGITFFGHNKGITNIDSPIYDRDSVLTIIKGCYFLNLNFMSEVEYELIDQPRPFFYGAFQQHSSVISTTSNEWYVGTFFWINRNKIYKNIELPKFYDRRYAECFPGNIGSGQNFTMLAHNKKIIYSDDLINAVTGKKLLELSLSNEEISAYNDFSEKIEAYEH